MAKGEQSHGIRRLSTMIIFIIIAGFLWLVIKLSDTYSVTEPFAIQYVDVPSDHIIQNDNHHIDVAMTASGFKLLNYYIKNRDNRKIKISLKDINYKKSSFETYTYSSKFVEDKVAEFISANGTDIHIGDEQQYFVMSRLVSKKVRIIPKTSITFDQQCNFYGKPMAIPDSVTIFGSINDISVINELYTDVIVRKNANQNIECRTKLDIPENVKCDVSNVDVRINVEKYTEAEMEVPIAVPDGINVHLYPDKTKIRYIVAMKEYAIINSLSFKAMVDTTGMYFNDVLQVNLMLYPNNTQIIGMNPKEVEYIIVR